MIKSAVLYFLRIMLVIFIFLITVPHLTKAQVVVPLYNGAIPDSKDTPDEEKADKGSVSNVSRPTLTVFQPSKEKASGTGIIICPGGGYGSLVMEREGYLIARTFTEMGITAFVLKYRLPSDRIMKNRSMGALQDAQQAIMLVRTMAAQYKLDVHKIGMIGFSAGGHLVSTAGTHFDKVMIENKAGISLRPDFMILVYPVISFTDSLAHKGSMNNLLGADTTTNMKNYFSNELQVSSATPPAILFHASDDIWVPASNSIRFYQALQKNNVPAALHIFSKGSHGFLLYPPLEDWMNLCKNWLRLNKFLDIK